MPHFLTKKGLIELEVELKKINELDLPAILEAVNSARQEGDLRENAAYQTAQKVKDELTTRQQEIDDILKDYEIIEQKISKGAAIVQLGSTVKVVYPDESTEFTFTIVGTSESDILANKISNESPIAQAILNKKVGDVAKFKAPKGKLEVKILDIK
jgi:transcription elongation factor GreA